MHEFMLHKLRPPRFAVSCNSEKKREKIPPREFTNHNCRIAPVAGDVGLEGAFFEFGTGQSRRKDTHFVRVKVYDEITRRYMSLSQVSVLPGSSPYASKAVTGVRGKYQKRERNLCVFAKNRQYPDQVGAS